MPLPTHGRSKRFPPAWLCAHNAGVRETLTSRPRVLDGGLSTALVETGVKLDPELWTAGALLDAPDALESVALAFLHAGAELLTTATYQASLAGFSRRGLDEAQARATLRDAVIQLRALAPVSVEIAASIGPYGAHLANGSEYRGDYRLDDAQIEAHFRPLIESMAPHADWLAFETFPQLDELLRVLDLLAGWPSPLPPVWVSLCTQSSGALADGSALREAARALQQHERVHMLGVNCCPSRRVLPLLRELAGEGDKALIAYPNLGDEGPDARKQPAARAFDSELIQTWADAGARVLGGCCGAGPRAIADLSAIVAGLKPRLPYP